MTFNDDFMQMEFNGQIMRALCVDLGIVWPPPEFLPVVFDGQKRFITRVSYSSITDEERADMTHVCRGAEYRPSTPEEIKANNLESMWAVDKDPLGDAPVH